MNYLFVIKPYYWNKTWVFDDKSRGLSKEPFVCGMDKFIDLASRKIPRAKKGFRVIFSSTPFPSFTEQLIWIKKDFGGNWYYSKKYKLCGWLCPAMYEYFHRAPKQIFLKMESL